MAPQDKLQQMVTEESWTGRLVIRYLLPVYENLQQRVPELGLPSPVTNSNEDTHLMDETAPLEPNPLIHDE